jgi:hypothetical protein
MFGNNAFGALGVDQNQAGPSRKQVQGDEIDVDVCHSTTRQRRELIISGYSWSRRIMMLMYAFLSGSI